jgi:hypothetical protein
MAGRVTLKLSTVFESPIAIAASHQTRKTSSFEMAERRLDDRTARDGLGEACWRPGLRGRWKKPRGTSRQQ